MSLIERYRQFYDYEKDCNSKMLAMLDTVPAANRSDPRFQQAVTLAGHLAACRENWLSFMDGDRGTLAAWFDKSCEFSTLHTRFAALESQWSDFLARLDEDKLLQDFAFTEEGERWQLPTEVQIVQLFGHASYHRGQVALLVDQLGGETVDTDYVYWAVPGSN